MIAQELEVSLHMAFVEARQKRHEFITVEHLLLALLDNPTAAEVLRACAANIDELRKHLTEFINAHTPTVAGTEEIDTQPTLGFQRVIQRAILHVQSSGKKEVTGANVLVAIFGEKDSHAVYFLHQQGVTRLDVVNYISHGITKSPQPAQPKATENEEAGEDGQQSGGALETYTVNLNAQALVGKIDPLIGRDRELERVIQTLCRRRKNNPLLVGEAGRRQDRDRRGPRAPDRRRPGARDPRQVPGLRARHGRAARRHQVSRRFRAAPEGGAQAADRQPERDPVHRRDPHPDRRRRRLGRHAGRVQPAQARAVDRRAEVHRRDDLQRVPRRVREGPRAVAALPEDRCRRAVGRRDGRDPEGPEEPLRGASRRQVQRQRADLGGGAVGALHQRPPSARQGDRRDRRGRRGAAHPAEVQAEAGDRQARDRGDHRQDRAHPAGVGVDGRPRRAEEPRPRPEGGRLRPGQGDRRARLGDPHDRARASAIRRSRSAASCSPARPASARPRSRASSPTAWASS